MKAPLKPFVVEIKQSRAKRDKPRSIWGTLDLAEVTRKVEKETDREEVQPAPDALSIKERG